MAVKYKTAGNWKITKVDVLRETDKSVFVPSLSGKERREAKLSKFHCYFDSLDEAKSHIISKAQEKVARCEYRMKAANGSLRKAMELKEDEQ